MNLCVCVNEKIGDGECVGCDIEECECGTGVGVNTTMCTTLCCVNTTMFGTLTGRRSRRNCQNGDSVVEKPMNLCVCDNKELDRGVDTDVNDSILFETLQVVVFVFFEFILLFIMNG
jgi:hypothetical protein